MAELGEQNRTVSQGHAHRADLLAALRVECRSRGVQAIAQVTAALARGPTRRLRRRRMPQ